MTRYSATPERGGFYITEDSSGPFARIDETLKEEREELLALFEKMTDIDDAVRMVRVRMASDAARKWRELAEKRYTFK